MQKDNNITSETEKITVIVDTKITISVGDIFEADWNETSKRVRVLGFKHDDLGKTKNSIWRNIRKASISFEGS